MRTSARPLRVLCCIDAILSGGTERQVVGLMQALSAHTSVRPYLCTLKPSSAPHGALDAAPLFLDFRSLRSASIVSVVRRLRSYILEHDIDVVYTFFQDPPVLAYLATRGLPQIGLVSGLRDAGFWRTRAKVWQLRAVWRAFDAFISNADSVASTFIALDDLDPTRMHVIANGLSVPADLPERPTSPEVVCIANFDRAVKRVDLFLETAARVATLVADARFVIVGEGHLRPTLEAQATALGLAERLTFVGRVEDVTSILERATVCIVPSDSEGLSNVILESMAHGVAVVARHVGGNPELIRDRTNGRLVSDHTPDALAAATIELLRDADTRSALVERARSDVAQRFAWDVCARAHESVFTRVCSERGRRA